MADHGGRADLRARRSAFPTRFTDDLEDFKRHVKKSSEEISAKLGHRAKCFRIVPAVTAEAR